MKKILIILTGGTICTEPSHNGVLSVGEKGGLALIENYCREHRGFEDKPEFVLSENLFILSENMTVDRWNLIIDTYRKHTETDSYDGIIIAHGTDTLGFSAALFSLILSGTDVPVFFVSSNKRLGLREANGFDNFNAAVECIQNGIVPNVYVTYKNISDGKMYLHLASKLRQCENYTDDFDSRNAFCIEGAAENVCDAVKRSFPPDKRVPFIDVYASWKLKPCVLFLKPYVGIDYSVFDYSPFSAVLHGTFHSGTVCSAEDNNSVLYMLKKCTEENCTDVYFSPSKPDGEIYESLARVKEYAETADNVGFLYGYTDEVAYAKLLLAYSIFEDEKQRRAFLETQCNFENTGGFDLYDRKTL